MHGVQALDIAAQQLLIWKKRKELPVELKVATSL